MIPTITADTLSLRFSAPWSLEDHAMFLRSKALPEAQIVFDDQADVYDVRAPARFAPLLGLNGVTAARTSLPLASHLFDYQRFIVTRALEAKRFAIWSDCGTGKTPMQLEWARQVNHVTGGRVLIFAPRAVIKQTCEEFLKFYPVDVGPTRLESPEEIAKWAKCSDPDAGWLAITNYEKMIPGVIPELRWLAGLVCDESSLLKSGGGVIKWNLIKSARGIEYKLSCTATPAPNDTMEYASQASFLEKLRNEGEILWTYFARHPKTQAWQVKPHARDAFYRFMAGWSIYLRKPALYGFADPFADIPEPSIIEHVVPCTDMQLQARDEILGVQKNGELLPADRLGVTQRTKLSQIAKGFRYDDGVPTPIGSTKPYMVKKLVKEEVARGRQVLVWCVFDAEAEIIGRLLYDVQHVAQLHGGTPETEREQILEDFRQGKIKVLVSKARMLGWGMNFQFCEAMIFSGFDDSFEAFYQAVRRCYRYGARNQLQVHVPYIPELENHVWENVLRKKSQWEEDTAQCEKAYAQAMAQIERVAA